MEKLTKDNVTFGREYRDNASGFTGQATAVCTYLEGNTDVRLERLKPDGTGVATEWFPVGRLSFTS